MAYNSTIARVGGGYCLAQLVASVRDNLAAGGAGNTVYLKDEFWSDNEVIRYINNAYLELWRIAKNLRSDLFTEIIASTDGTVNIGGENYDPSVLQLAQDVVYYTLPPDLSEIKAIQVITSEQEGTVFRFKDRATEEFKTALRRNASTGSGEFIYDIIGRRTLIIAPKPQEALDIEITYNRRLKRLLNTTDDSVSITNGASEITNLGGASVLHGQQFVGGGVVIDVNEIYPVIISNVGQTATIFPAYQGPTITADTGVVSPVTEIDDCDDLIIHHATAAGFRKGSSPNLKKAGAWEDEYQRLLPGFKTSFMKRDYGPEFVEAYLEDA